MTLKLLFDENPPPICDQEKTDEFVDKWKDKVHAAYLAKKASINAGIVTKNAEFIRKHTDETLLRERRMFNASQLETLRTEAEIRQEAIKIATARSSK